MMRHACVPFFLLGVFGCWSAFAGEKTVSMLPGENWWGLCNAFGREMPFTEKTDFKCDLRKDNYGHQSLSFLCSDKGRAIWCAEPVGVKIAGGEIALESDKGEIILKEDAGRNLGEAYRYGSKTWFPPTGEELELDNRGEEALMLRPRKDVEVLAPADGFKMNLLRAYLELSALLVLLIAFAVSLSAALGRPVAVFVAVVTLVLAEMSPSVIEQYPDELETDKIDAIGLFLTRIAAEVTHPVSGITPLEKLADHECVEWSETLRTLSTHAILLPGLLILLSSFILPKKQ